MRKNNSSSLSDGCRGNHYFRRIIYLMLVFSMLIQLLPAQAFAVWDGSGSSGGTGSHFAPSNRETR